MNIHIDAFLKNFFPCLSRPYKKLDFSDKRIYLGLFLFFIIYIFYGLYIHLNLNSAILLALKKSIILILSYHIMQELEPDMKQNYPLAISLASIALIFPHEARITGIFLILLSSRILARSSGFKVSFIELIITLFISLYLFLFSTYSYSLMLTLILGMDIFFDNKNKKELPFFMMIGIISIIGFLKSINYFTFLPRPNNLWSFIFILITLIFIFRISFIKTIYSANDMALKAISPKRIKALNSIVLLTLFIESFIYGNHLELISIWAIILGLSIPYLRDIIKKLK